MKSGILARLTFVVLASLLFENCLSVHAASWYPLGPFGGDARALAADPTDNRHLYLGTEIGWLYDSHDAGATWTRVSQIASQDDLVIDHILVDVKNPKRLVVGTWRVGASDGGVYISEDSGKTWNAQSDMKRQSVRAMARSDSDPHIILAGTLQGIFQSNDDGVHWRQISPADSKEIHEVESLAIDPTDPKVIYAGTWHLPWKTTDGGENWVNIKQGIIDDSDVFSIVVDPKDTKTIYLSACSGIYKSTDAAEQFHKIQGIPSTARRTRKLLQDPTDPNTVYAGTTEGLYKTTDAGKTFSRMTESDVIVNDVYVDPKDPRHVLIATDRGGVLSSEDAGVTFSASNSGFSARHVSSFAADTHNPSHIYVGVVNGKQTGGVFTSNDGGLKWAQQSSGLHGQDVFSLLQTPAGTLLAGTGHGIFRFDPDQWVPSNDLISPSSQEEPKASEPTAKRPQAVPKSKQASKTRAQLARPRRLPAMYELRDGSTPIRLMAYWQPSKSRRRVIAKKTAVRTIPAPQRRVVPAPRLHKAEPAAKPKLDTLDAEVFALESTGDAIFAGTTRGLLRSAADGHAWEPVKGLELPDVHFIGSHDQLVLAAGLKAVALSSDGGQSWSSVAMPSGLTQIGAVAVDDLGTLWVGGVEGIFYSKDQGASWQTLRELFLRSVTSILPDANEHRVYVTSSLSHYAFIVQNPDRKVTYVDTGWPLRFIRPVGDHLVAATLFEGMVVQPVMRDTPFAAAGK